MEKLLLQKFNAYIRENQLIAPGDRILLTVSGGVDSMVMLSLFARSGYDIGVAHCNFQLRGEESEEDEQLVEQAAARFGVPFHNKRFATREEMERTGESVQMAARRLRYEWFNALCDEHGYTSIAIAHQADDSIETFFINLLRGTGLRGLTGISVLNGRVIRPLLFASRKEIAEYAVANRIDFREDSSNRSTKYLRNKIRLGLIPRIREINPKFTDLMSANVRRLVDAQLFINRSIELLRRTAVEERDGLTVIDPARIDRAFPLDFVIYEMLNSGHGFKGDVTDALCRALEKGAAGRRFYSRDYMACIDRGRIVISPIPQEDPCEVVIEENAHRAYCGNSVLYFEWLDIDNVETANVPANVALLDAGKLRFPLAARRWNAGDHFVPFGMTGHKKVSDLLIDEKVPLPEKQRQFVLLSGEDIVWVIGRRTDDRYRLTSSTEQVLRITREIVS